MKFTINVSVHIKAMQRIYNALHAVRLKVKSFNSSRTINCQEEQPASVDFFGKSRWCFSTTWGKNCFCSSWFVMAALSDCISDNTMFSSIIDGFHRLDTAQIPNITRVWFPLRRKLVEEVLWNVKCYEELPGICSDKIWELLRTYVLVFRLNVFA